MAKVKATGRLVVVLLEPVVSMVAIVGLLVAAIEDSASKSYVELSHLVL